MMTFETEQVQLAQIEDALHGLANFTAMFKSGVLEQEYWNKTPEQVHDETIEICQTIITCLNGVCYEIKEVGNSLDRMEIKQHHEEKAKLKAV